MFQSVTVTRYHLVIIAQVEFNFFNSHLVVGLRLRSSPINVIGLDIVWTAHNAQQSATAVAATIRFVGTRHTLSGKPTHKMKCVRNTDQ